MIRAVALVELLVGWSAAHRPGVAECERYVLGKIATPSTFQRVGSYAYERAGKLRVSIDYDAQNLAGALVRETQHCTFPIVDGRPQTTQYIDHDAELMSDP